ncbi:DNA-dependent ATPase fun30, partial [Exophiala xenobiotica]
MSSHSSLSESDDELFNPDYKPPHETVETLPLRRANMSDDDVNMETLSTLPPHLPSQKLNQSRQTQPTQLINRSPDLASSPVKGGVVQVTASSPLAA